MINLTVAILSFAYAFWRLRSYRWPRVQVVVLKSWKEVKDLDEDGYENGWLHAELEYWYEGKKFTVPWRADLHNRNHLPAVLWMAIHPDRLDQPQLLPRWTGAVVAAVIGILFVAAAIATLSVR